MHSEGTDSLHIDGRTLEGGGQLLRLAVGLAALQGRAIHITHIRGLRKGSRGLKAQHLACVRWLAAACGASTEGADIRSESLVFRPQKQLGITTPDIYTKSALDDGKVVYDVRIDIGSPGSVGLLLQAVLPFILFRPPPSQADRSARPTVRLNITGGTNVSKSPSYEYIKQVLLPTLSSIGIPNIEAQIERRGWSIRGSSVGSVSLLIPCLRSGEKISNKKLQMFNGIDESHRHPSTIEATLIAPKSLYDTFTKSITNNVNKIFGKLDNFTISREDSQHEKRIYLIVVAKVRCKNREFIFGSDELTAGRKGVAPDALADEIAARVLRRLSEDVKSGVCVDRHMVDQLIVFQALADGVSHVSRDVSREQDLHADTAEWIARRILDTEIHAGKCEGTGLVARGAGGES